jgi:hypothetical protein
MVVVCLSYEFKKVKFHVISTWIQIMINTSFCNNENLKVSFDNDAEFVKENQKHYELVNNLKDQTNEPDSPNADQGKLILGRISILTRIVRRGVSKGVGDDC